MPIRPSGFSSTVKANITGTRGNPRQLQIHQEKGMNHLLIRHQQLNEDIVRKPHGSSILIHAWCRVRVPGLPGLTAEVQKRKLLLICITQGLSYKSHSLFPCAQMPCLSHPSQAFGSFPRSCMYDMRRHRQIQGYHTLIVATSSTMHAVMTEKAHIRHSKNGISIAMY